GSAAAGRRLFAGGTPPLATCRHRPRSFARFRPMPIDSLRCCFLQTFFTSGKFFSRLVQQPFDARSVRRVPDYFFEKARCSPNPAKAAAKLRLSLALTGADSMTLARNEWAR